MTMMKIMHLNCTSWRCNGGCNLDGNGNGCESCCVVDGGDKDGDNIGNGANN